MNNNQIHTGSNWNGRCPRTAEQAFGHSLRSHDLTFLEQERKDRRGKVRDVLLLALAVGALAALANIGSFVGL